MADKRKINEGHRIVTINGESDAYRKFRFQFNQLLTPEDTPRNEAEFKKLYVHDSDFEGQIEEFKKNSRNASACVIGYTGIGKSTSIRYCFSIGVQKSSFFKGHELVFPTFLDGYQITDEKKFDITARIRAVCTLMKETYPDLVDYMRTNEGKDALYRFIRQHTERALEGTDSVDEFDWDQPVRIENKLKAARDKFGYQYYANELKFYISRHYDTIKEFVIILDDIESLPDDFQNEAIHTFIKFYECMKNTEYPLLGDYSVKLLISMRPHTHRRYLASRTGEPYGIGSCIIKRHCVPLNELFENRFKFYSSLNPTKIGEPTSWEKCLDALKLINDQFDRRYMEMIARLCFYSVRQSLYWYTIILSNRFWVQNNIQKEQAFIVDDGRFHINNVTVPRAMACKENDVYHIMTDCIIPSILLNTQTEDLSILSLMIAIYFDKKTVFDSYGMDDNTERVCAALAFWKEVCGNDYEGPVRRVIDYLFDIKVLRKAIQNTEEYLAVDNHLSLEDDSMLYISPKGRELLDMLKNDSVYFEMMRESSWRDYEVFQFNSSSSYELTVSKQQELIYKDLLDYISYLCDKEEDILRKITANNMQSTYSSVMGTTPVCSLLLKGVDNSLKYTSLKDQNKELRKKYSQTELKTNRLMMGFTR